MTTPSALIGTGGAWSEAGAIALAAWRGRIGWALQVWRSGRKPERQTRRRCRF